MHIDTRDLLQDHFSIFNTCDAGIRILLLNDETLIEKIDNSVFDVGMSGRCSPQAGLLKIIWRIQMSDTELSESSIFGFALMRSRTADAFSNPPRVKTKNLSSAE